MHTKHHVVNLSAHNLLVGRVRFTRRDWQCPWMGKGSRLDVRRNGGAECSGKIVEAEGSAERHTR